MRDLATASKEYKLGRMGRTPYDMDSWTTPAVADYNAGKRDRDKIKRSARRSNAIENVLATIVAIFGIIAIVLMWAFVAALPFVIVLFVAHLLGAF
jgi:hypothetical protein